MYEAIRETRWAAVVYATCRRNGTYSRLDLYAAVRAEASRAATVWLDALVNAILEQLGKLEQDPSFSVVPDDIRLRKKLYQDAQIKVIRGYAEQVGVQVQSHLKPDQNLWELCRGEWGRGEGFKNRILGHLEIWSRRQQIITAHESTEAASLIPLFGEVSLPAQAPRFTLQVRNLRVLRRVAWNPTPLTVLIGANGAGKTTLLQTLRLLRLAYERGLPEAVTIVLGGSGNLRSWGVTEEDPVEIGIDLGEASWRIQLTPREGSVDYLTHERLSEQGREIFSRDSLGAFSHGRERIEPSPPQLALRTLMDRGTHEPAVRAMAKFLQRILVYHDFDLWTLRRQGSNTSEDRLLHSRGLNALALLRRWRQDPAHNHRYRFVLEGLGAAFPNAFADLDFVEAGNTLVARIYRPGEESPSPLADEANGVLQLLVLFCAVASAEDESVVAIDEPEDSLHPYALRAFLRRTSRWADQYNLSVLLATHSTVLLDELTGHPERIYVMKAQEPREPVPTCLDQLCDPGWLEHFKLGDLYEQGEIGSNEDET
ncbi:MAG: AAA family ATPase [Methylococcales bacterium]